MNPNRNPEYNYSMNMNFPSLNQANPSSNYSNNLVQNMNMQKGGNLVGHPNNEAFGQNQSNYFLN